MRISELKEKYKSCNKCDKCISENKICGTGDDNADIMFIGDSPGRAEGSAKTPFAGPSEEMLDKIIQAMGLEREKLYFTNTTLCVPNGKDRTPSLEEMQNCAERLDEEINIVKPNVIVMVGSSCLKRFFGNSSKLSECHGRWFFDFNPPYARYFSFYHPSWALNSVSDGELKSKKRILWEDSKKFISELEVANFKIKEG
jgi:uracil-DNA glycosylase